MTYDNVVDVLIATIVQSQSISEQLHLQQRLKSHGHDIPQATLSRRLKKLNIAKVAGIYKAIDYKQLGLPLVLNLQISDAGFIVLQTKPSHASSLALYLDQKYISFDPDKLTHSGMIGTIAGDDTVLVILKHKDHLEKTLALLRLEFPYLPINHP